MHQKFKSSDHITDYAIGDVHGCVEQLKIALDWCAADALQSGTQGRVHLLGDYVDRGPSAKDVIDLLISGPEDEHMSWHPIKGNHDDMFSSVWFNPSHEMATAYKATDGILCIIRYQTNFRNSFLGSMLSFYVRFQCLLKPIHTSMFMQE
jgi:serine/threonine protein phosphatase 1